MLHPARPMTLVVGGVVPASDVVGRYRDVEAVLASLPHSGAVLVGDRRHGKTSLSRLAQGAAADLGSLAVATSAERETYGEFVAALASELAKLEPRWAQEVSRLRVSLTAGPLKIERISVLPPLWTNGCNAPSIAPGIVNWCCSSTR